MVNYEKWRNIYVCNAMGHRLYQLTEIEEDSVKFAPRLNGQWELNFNIKRKRDERDAAMESLCEGMYLLVEDVGYFKILPPTIDMDAATETKQIRALSNDAELEDKNLDISVNMGLETSQEYLIQYDDGETELLLNPYKKNPYDWIVLDNRFPEQLEELQDLLERAEFITYGDEQVSSELPPWIRDDGMHDPSGGTAHIRLRQPRRYGTESNPVYVDRYYMDVRMDDYPEFYAMLTKMLTMITRLQQKVSTATPSINADAAIVDDIVDANDTKYYVEKYAEELLDNSGTVIGWRLYDAIFTHDIVQDDIVYETGALGRTDELAAFYRKYHDQLSLLNIVCDKTGGNWSVGKIHGVQDGDYTLANSKFQFEINETIYSFLTSTLAQQSKCVVNFDLLHRKINMTPVDKIGEDSGIVIDYDTLLNSLHMQSNDTSLCTRINVRGGNDITLEQINFGEPYVEDLSYKMNVRNSQHERIYVPDILAEKYMRYREYRDDYARPKYIDLSKRYNELTAEINELKYRVPNDSMSMDWGTCTDEELSKSLISYQRLLYALLQLYADDYAMPPDTRYWTEIVASQSSETSDEWQYIDDAGHVVTLPPWFSGVSANYGGSHYIPKPTFVQNTMYWWDYYAYHETLQQIKTAMIVRQSTTDDPGYSYRNITNEQLLAKIKAWETEWSLYGSIELENKIAAYENQLQVMVDSVMVVRKHTTYEAFKIAKPNWSPINTTLSEQLVYAHMCTILAKHALWESLSPTQQNYFGSIIDYESCKEIIQIEEDIYEWTSSVPGNQLPAADKQLFGGVEANYFYGDYQKILAQLNDAQLAKADLDALIDAKMELRDTLQSERTELANKIQLQNYSYSPLSDFVESTTDNDGDGNTAQYTMLPDAEGFQNLSGYDPQYADETFSEVECKCIINMYRDAEYTNENILTTSLNDTVDSLSHLQELYDDATEQLSRLSRPQLQFTIDSDNFLAIPEFAPFCERFGLGNYISVAYRDGTYVKLRMIEYEINPFLPETGLSMQFSSFIRSRTEYTDVESLLGMTGSVGISSYGGGGSGGGGSSVRVGDDSVIDVTISNTMLGRLLQPGGLSDSLSENLGISSLSAKALAEQIANAMRIGNVSSGNAALASGFNILTKQSAKGPVYTGLQDGSTIVSADCLQGGRIESLRGSVRPVYQTNSDGEYVLDANGARIPVYETDEQGAIIYDEDDNPVQKQQWEPFSWFDLDGGRFSFGGGALTFERETGQSVGQLAVSGIIKATGGNVGDVLIGSSTIDETLYNRMVIGKNGFYKYDHDGMNLKSLMDFRPCSTSDIGWIPAEIALGEGEGFLRLGSYHDVDYAYREALVTPLVIRLDDNTDHNVAWAHMTAHGFFTNGEIETTSSLTVWNSYKDRGVKLYVDGTSYKGHISLGGDIAAGGSITAASISATSMSATGAITGGSLDVGQGTISGGNINIVADANNHIVKNGIFCKGTYLGASANNWENVIRAHDGNDNAARLKYAELRCNGEVYATGKVYGTDFAASGADYAEYFEWQDGNPQGDDRRGRFVTLDGDQIRLATSDDAWIYGIVSSAPSVVGNSAYDHWHDKYLRDTFGAILTEPVEHAATIDDDGNVLVEAYTEYRPIINPRYDPSLEYVPRAQRHEWSPVGVVGQLVMLDDGTCEVNGFATSADEGIATKADGITNYRVIKRIDSNHIMVAAK